MVFGFFCDLFIDLHSSKTPVHLSQICWGIHSTARSHSWIWSSEKEIKRERGNITIPSNVLEANNANTLWAKRTGKETRKTAPSPWDFITLPEQD